MNWRPGSPTSPARRRLPRRSRWHRSRQRWLGTSTALAVTVGALTFGVGTLSAQAASDTERAITGGTLSWGVKKSFRDYVAGPIANGAVSVTDGAVRNDDGTIAFPVVDGAYDRTNDHTTVRFGGTVAFNGHAGALALSVSDPELDITGSTGVLSAEMTSKRLDSGQSIDYGRVDVANVDAASGVSIGGAKLTLTTLPATLSTAGAPAFAGFYAAGTALDPISADLGLDGGIEDDAASSLSVHATRATFGYGETTTVAIGATSPGGTPTGQISLNVAGHTLTKSLTAGSASITLPGGLTPGTYPLTATFLGSHGIAASTGSTTVRITKAMPRVAFSLVKAKVRRTRHARIKVVATVPAATSVRPYGQIVVRDGRRVITTKALKVSDNGRVTIRLPKLKKGKHKLTVALRATSLLSTAASGKRTLRVTK